jgi:hypothetical protein
MPVRQPGSACLLDHPSDAIGQRRSYGHRPSFIADGLFIGQNPQFLERLMELASEAEAARREVRD